MRSAAHEEQIKMANYNDFFNFIHHYEEHSQNISFFPFDRRLLAETNVQSWGRRFRIQALSGSEERSFAMLVDGPMIKETALHFMAWLKIETF